MRAQRQSPEGAPPTATLASVDPDYGTALPGDMKTRLARLDWRGIERSLWQWGYAKTPPVLSPSECAELISLYADARRFRSTIDMARYKCLHQDLYADVVFPWQLTCFLSRRGGDYTGGDFLLVEQRPRAQSRGEAIATEQGEIVIFATRYRPVEGARGVYRSAMRHGVSRVTSGSRYTLG